MAQDFVLGKLDYLLRLRRDFIQDMNMVLALSTHGPT